MNSDYEDLDVESPQFHLKCSILQNLREHENEDDIWQPIDETATGEQSSNLVTSYSESEDSSYPIDDLELSSSPYFRRGNLRTDEVLKHIVRKIFKFLRSQFQIFFSQLTGDYSLRHTEAQELETVLFVFLKQKKQFTVKSDEVETAKKIFFNFLGRRELEKISVLKTGSRKAIIEFFQAQIARELVFPLFKRSMIQATSLCPNTIRGQLREIIEKVHGQCFTDQSE